MGLKVAAIVAFLSLLIPTSALPYGIGTKGSPIRNYDQLSSGDPSWDQGHDSGGQHVDYSAVQLDSNSNLENQFTYENMDTEVEVSGEPDFDVNHFGDNESGRGGGTDISPPVYLPEQTDKGHSYGESETWMQKLAKKWNKLADKTKTAAESVGRSVHAWYSNIHETLPQIWEDFKKVLSKFSLMIHRGAEYVVHEIVLTVDKVKASELITKLERRLVEGDEMVDEFFQKLGEKITLWKQKYHPENIDEGLYPENIDYSQHFTEPNFPDLFQDPEIHTQLNKMVAGGSITQQEMDLLYQEKDGKEGSFSIHNNPQTEPRPAQIDSNSYGDVGISSDSQGNIDPHHTVKKELLDDDASQLPAERYPSDTLLNDENTVAEVHPSAAIPNNGEYVPQSYPQIEEIPPQGYPQIEERPSHVQSRPQIEEQTLDGYDVHEVIPPQEYPQAENEEQPSLGYPQIEQGPLQGYPQTEDQEKSATQQGSKGRPIYFPNDMW